MWELVSTGGEAMSTIRLSPRRITSFAGRWGTLKDVRRYLAIHLVAVMWAYCGHQVPTRCP